MLTGVFCNESYNLIMRMLLAIFSDMELSSLIKLSLFFCRAVWRPVEYHNRYNGIDTWDQVLKSYLFPVIMLSVAFNLPKLFEVEVVTREEEKFYRKFMPNSTTNETFYVSRSTFL